MSLRRWGGGLWGLECVQITSPRPPPLPAPPWPLSSQLLSLSVPRCVSLPASLGSPEALPLWPETSNVPKPGSRPGSPLTPPSSHFPELTPPRPVPSFCPGPVPCPDGQEEHGAGSPRDPADTASNGTSAEGCWARTLPPLSPPWGGGRTTAGSVQGCHYPAGRGFPTILRL